MKKSSTKKAQINKNISVVKKYALEKAKATHLASSAFYSGPLPLPAHWAQYEAILPGAAERILSMAEKTQTHIQEIEKVSLKEEVKYLNKGQNIACVVCGSAFLLTAFLAMNGHDVVAGIVVGSTLVALATTFIKGSSKVIEKPDTKKPKKTHAKS